MSRSAASTLLLAPALPALAQQSPKDVEMPNKHAGTWAADCAKPGTRLTVSVDALTLEAAGHERRVGAPITTFSHFGRQLPPEGFEVALLEQFGTPALAGKFRPCS